MDKNIKEGIKIYSAKYVVDGRKFDENMAYFRLNLVKA